VESARIDGIYPRGVPIGIVASVSRGSKMFLQIRVTPSADFARLTDVLLLEPSPAANENLEVGKGGGWGGTPGSRCSFWQPRSSSSSSGDPGTGPSCRW